jgi:hypothetical protein
MGGLRVQGIGGDESPDDVDRVEKLWQHGNLVRLAVHVELTQDDCGIVVRGRACLASCQTGPV